MTAQVPLATDVLRGTPRAGDIEHVEAVARFVEDVWLGVAVFSSSVLATQAQLSSLAGNAVAALGQTLEGGLVPGAAAVEESASAACSATRVYRREIDRVHGEAEAIVARVARRLQGIAEEWRTIAEIARVILARPPEHWEAPPEITMPEPSLRADAPDLGGAEQLAQLQLLRDNYRLRWQSAVLRWREDLGEIRAAQARWDALIEERVRAERALVTRLQDTALAQFARLGSGLPGGRQQAVALGLLNEPAGTAAGTEVWDTDHPLLAGLFEASDGSIAQDPPPSPGRVLTWWEALTPEQREELIASIPTVIGNLGGLLPSVRDRANRVAIAGFCAQPQGLDAEQLRVLAQTQRILDTAAAQRIPNPPVQVLAFDLVNGVPKAAIGYGDLERSTHTSWLVPGMGSDASAALPTWDTASRTLFQTQNSLMRRAEGGSPAVIAWLGYDTPNPPPSTEVLQSTRAAAGAEQLAAELDAMFVARASLGGELPVSSVVAHSYGTTVAAIALTRVTYPLDTFVMLGSAGLDLAAVPAVGSLNVGDSHTGQPAVYATNAPADRIAPTGAALARRGLPTTQANPLFGLGERVPRYGGVTEFPAAGDAARGLAATDGHSLLGEGARPGPLGLTASLGQGYGDPDTQSLNTTARIVSRMIDPATLRTFQVTPAPRDAYGANDGRAGDSEGTGDTGGTDGTASIPGPGGNSVPGGITGPAAGTRWGKPEQIGAKQ